VPPYTSHSQTQPLDLALLFSMALQELTSFHGKQMAVQEELLSAGSARRRRFCVFVRQGTILKKISLSSKSSNATVFTLKQAFVDSMNAGLDECERLDITEWHLQGRVVLADDDRLLDGLLCAGA
jgi:hypothetical protein